MLQEIADFLVYQGLGLQPDSTLGGAVNFFVYDSMKIFLMLTKNYMKLQIYSMFH